MVFMCLLLAFSISGQFELKKPVLGLGTAGEHLIVFQEDAAEKWNADGEQVGKKKLPEYDQVYRWKDGFFLTNFRKYEIHWYDPADDDTVITKSLGKGFSFTLDPKKAMQIALEQSNFKPYFESETLFIFAKRKRCLAFLPGLVPVDSFDLPLKPRFLAYHRGKTFAVTDSNALLILDRKGEILDSLRLKNYVESLKAEGGYLFLSSVDSLIVLREDDLSRVKAFGLKGMKSVSCNGNLIFLKCVSVMGKGSDKLICLDGKFETLWERETDRVPLIPVLNNGEKLYLGNGKWLLGIDPSSGAVVDSLYLPLGKRKLSLAEKMMSKISPIPISDEVYIDGIAEFKGFLWVYGHKKLFRLKK